MEKDLETVMLLDTYSGLLTEKQLRLCDMYYNQDYSLSEIAGIEHTTRQAARDGISKARQKLQSFEAALSLCGRRIRTSSALQKARAVAADPAMKAILDEISDIWGNDNGV